MIWLVLVRVTCCCVGAVDWCQVSTYRAGKRNGPSWERGNPHRRVVCFYRACKHRWTTPLCWCVSSFQCFDVLAVIPHGALSWDVPGSSYSLASSSFRRSSLPQQNILPRARRACATRTVALPGQKRVTASMLLLMIPPIRTELNSLAFSAPWEWNTNLPRASKYATKTAL